MGFAKSDKKWCAVVGSLVLTSLYVFIFLKKGYRGPTNGHTTQSLLHIFAPFREFRSDLPFIVSLAVDFGGGCPKCLEPVPYLSAKLTIIKDSLLAIEDTKR